MEEQDQLRELRRTELREIMKGVEQIRNGQYTTLETPEAYGEDGGAYQNRRAQAARSKKER